MGEKPPLIWIVVPAAGIGSRMGTERPKQYLPLCGKTLLEVTFDTLLQLKDVLHLGDVAGIVVALNDDDQIWPTLPFANNRYIHTVKGGNRRCDSVLNAIDFIAGSADNSSSVWVCVHDAARPCVSLEKINQLITCCIEGNIGAILAAPIADTVKRVDANRIIENTEDREQLWHAHTPQMFKLAELRQSLKYCIENKLPMTDEASAVEQTGGQVRVVVDRRDNIKVTVPEDLAWAETILANRIKGI